MFAGSTGHLLSANSKRDIDTRSSSMISGSGSSSSDVEQFRFRFTESFFFDVDIFFYCMSNSKTFASKRAVDFRSGSNLHILGRVGHLTPHHPRSRF
jgi:hypothetical protein